MENVKPVDQSIISNNSKADNLTAANTLNSITDVNALDNQGNNLSSHGRFDLAITFYDKALALDPSNLKVLIHKADSLSRLSRYKDAVNTYNKTPVWSLIWGLNSSRYIFQSCSVFLLSSQWSFVSLCGDSIRCHSS